MSFSTDQLPSELDLLVTQYVDYFLTPIWSLYDGSGNLVSPMPWTGATGARLMSRAHPSDAIPLLSLSTTVLSQGGLFFGPTTDPFGTQVPAGGIEIWIAKSLTGQLPVGVTPLTLLVDWANGTSTPFATGNLRVRVGETH